MECRSLVIIRFLSDGRMYYYALLLKLQVLRIPDSPHPFSPGQQITGHFFTGPGGFLTSFLRAVPEQKAYKTDSRSCLTGQSLSFFASTYSSVFHKLCAVFLSIYHKNKKLQKKFLQMVFLSFTLYPTSTYSLTTKPVPSTYDFVLVTLPVNQGKLTLFRYFLIKYIR